MRAAKVLCDGCGAEKGEVNHWFSAAKVRHGSDPILVFTPYVGPSEIHLCGHVCAHKLLSQYLEGM